MPSEVAILDDRLQPRVEIKSQSDRKFSFDVNGRSITSFYLQTPETFKTCHFTSLFFYEPFVTDKFNATEPYSTPVARHIFSVYFPHRKVYFYPKCIILQSARPSFALHRSFLEFYYHLVCEPYLRLQKPQMMPKLKAQGQRRRESAVQHKDFFWSFIFAAKIEELVTQTFVFRHLHFEEDMIRYNGYLLQESDFELVGRLLSREEHLGVVVTLFYLVLFEHKVVIVHPHPTRLLHVLLSLIKP